MNAIDTTHGRVGKNAPPLPHSLGSYAGRGFLRVFLVEKLPREGKSGENVACRQRFRHAVLTAPESPCKGKIGDCKCKDGKGRGF